MKKDGWKKSYGTVSKGHHISSTLAVGDRHGWASTTLTTLERGQQESGKWKRRCDTTLKKNDDW